MLQITVLFKVLLELLLVVVVFSYFAEESDTTVHQRFSFLYHLYSLTKHFTVACSSVTCPLAVNGSEDGSDLVLINYTCFSEK